MNKTLTMMRFFTFLITALIFICPLNIGAQNCLDSEAPMFTTACPGDITIECSDPLPVAPVLMATDDCGFPGGIPDALFINEFHYDNTGGDVGEFIEVAGSAGLDLTGYSLLLYNGSNGTVYNTINLTGIIPNEIGGAGAIDFQLPSNGLQNGAPDGFALVDPAGTVLEFLSYEGTITATAGAANGMMSTNVGVSETSGTAVGQSLQLIGVGMPGTFTWTGPAANSPGSINAGQTIELGTTPGPIDVTAVDVFVVGACANEGVITRTWTATDASGKTATCVQLITLEDNTLPTFNETLPANETTSCGVIPAAAVLTASDNCGGNVLPWVNEFHYDNAGGDVGEFIEVAGFAGTNLAGYTLALYNGNGGGLSSTINLSGIIPDEGNNYGALSFAATGLMNGSPDGFALVDPNGVVIEFLSYEGTFIGTSGPANGLTSTNVGVVETSGTAIGQSLQLIGSGGMGSDFTWSGPSAESPGTLNAGQIITGNVPVVFEEVTTGDCASGSTITRTWTATDACGNAAIHMQTITVVPDNAPVIDCPLNIIVHLDPGACDAIINWNAPSVTDDCTTGITVTQTGGPVSGTTFDRGTTTTITYTSSADDCGNISTCSFDITIIEFVPTTGDITCNNLSNITLDAETCTSVVGADQILLGNNYGCYDDYPVTFADGPNVGQPVILGAQHIGQTIQVMVTNPAGNPCWGEIFVEDKTIPELVCTDVTVRCDDDTAPGSLFAGTTDYAFATLPSVDNSTVTETVIVPAGIGGTASTVLDLNVAIESTHTWVGDLIITVTSPSGTSVELLNNLGGPGFGCNNAAGLNMSVVMDDEATATYADMNALCPPTGTFQPLEALSAFNGEDAAGTWTISVQDLVGGDGGDQDITLNLTATNSAIIAFAVPATTTVLPTNDANTWTLLGFDPCGPATLTSSDSEAGDLCAGTRAITRTWTVTDGAGNSNSCTETITITPTTIADVLASLPTNVELECGAALPPVLTDIGCSNIGISLAGPPVIIDICGGPGTFKMLREYIIVDWCTNETATHVQIIKVSDTQAPVLTCPADMNISTSSNSCSGAVILTAPTWTDCAGGVTVVPTSADGTITNVGGNWTISDIASGTTATVTWTATDACDNASTCDVNITVSDDIAPTPVCIETTTVSITSDGTAFINAPSFNSGSHDNCGIVNMLARRMDNPACPGFDGTPYAETVPFSCCDVNTTVMVEFQVWDEAGNTNSCMIEVLVEDKLNPSIICPANIILECDEDYTDLALTGEAIGTDNCSATVSYFDSGSPNDCGEGTVFRIWTATDPGGRTASCVQRIDIVNTNPFYINANNSNDPTDDVVWPSDYTATTCGTGLEPTDLPAPFNKPVITEGACDNIAYGHWDLPLTFGADDACLKILRKWYIIDWCQAAGNQDPTQAGPGVWHHVQILKVINSNDPTITAVTLPATIENFDADCGNATATFNITADDDCTDQDNLQITWAFSTGTTGSGTSATGQFANGSYSVTFTVNDGCDNEATLVHNFIVKDAKKPTPICIAGLATTVMPSSGSVSIPVSAFQSGDSYDNCTDYAGLQFSFSQDVNNTAMVITCDDIPADNLVPVTMYVTDAEGNFDFCSTFIFVQDPTGACPDPTATIQGTIQNELEENIQDVTVTLSDDAGMNMPVVTLADGTYNFGMTFGDYDVTPEKDINYLNGVTTYDLALISRHILGTEILDSPYKWIAADANHSETITALDIIKLRALILHIDDELANNDSWRFVEKNYVFQTTNNPLADDFPEVVELSASNTSAVNFIAVKIGDVNGTAIPNQLLGTDTRTFDGKLALQVATEKVAAGEEFTVDFRAKDFNNIAGYQFTIGFENASFVDVTSNLSGLTTANFGLTKLDEGVITTSWNTNTAVSVENNEVLFSMTFVANTNLNTADAIAINSRYTESEAYSGNDLFDVVLEFNGTEVSNGFELYQNTPNPFKAETTIGFNVPEAGAITLKVFDVSGRVLRVVEMDAAKGFNAINLDRASLDASGVLYYQLETATETATKKMIIVD